MSPSDRTRALLSAARSDAPAPAARARVKAAITAQLLAAAPLAGATSTTAGSSADGTTIAENSPAGNTAAGNTTAGNTTAGNTTAGNTTAGSAAVAKVPAITVGLGKAVLAALLTGVLGFAAGLSFNRAPAFGGHPAATTASSAAPDITASNTAAQNTAAPNTAAPSTTAPNTTTPDIAASDTGSPRAPVASALAAAPRAPANAPIRDAAAISTPRAARPKPTAGSSAGAAPALSSSAAEPAESSLAAELALMREVNAALHEGDTARAERWITEHAARHPRGVLREERDAARVQLLCAQGKPAEARAAADTFLREHPRSLQLSRVQRSCASVKDAAPAP